MFFYTLCLRYVMKKWFSLGLLLLAVALLLFPMPLPLTASRGPAAMVQPLRCHNMQAAALTLLRNGRARNDSTHGPLELHVPGCSDGGAAAGAPFLVPGASSRACLRRRHVLFLGDSTMRFSFLNFIHWLHAETWDTGEPPLERDSAAWGENGWDSFFAGTAARVPHLCDCARCHGAQLFEEASRWDVGGVRMLCAMENRYYIHPASGTRASFVLLFGRNPIGWNAPNFLGYDCFPSGCPAQQGCPPGGCYPPQFAAPAMQALRRLLAELSPTDIVLSSGVWGDYEAPEDLEALLGALASAPGRPRVLWRTPTPPRPGAHPLGEWSKTWHSPATSAAFRARGWGVVPSGALTAAAMAWVDLQPLMPCARCIEAVEGRIADTAPHWSCTYCVMRRDAGDGGEGRHAGLLAELGEEAGRTQAWPWAERDALAEGILARSREARGGAEGIGVESVWDDWIHAAPWFNRLHNTLLIAHLCETN